MWRFKVVCWVKKHSQKYQQLPEVGRTAACGLFSFSRGPGEQISVSFQPGATSMRRAHWGEMRHALQMFHFDSTRAKFSFECRLVCVKITLSNKHRARTKVKQLHTVCLLQPFVPLLFVVLLLWTVVVCPHSPLCVLYTFRIQGNWA